MVIHVAEGEMWHFVSMLHSVDIHSLARSRRSGRQDIRQKADTA